MSHWTALTNKNTPQGILPSGINPDKDPTMLMLLNFCVFPDIWISDFRHRKVTRWPIFWNCEGPTHWNLIERERSVNVEVYCEQLELSRRALERRHRRPVFLLQDDDRSRAPTLLAGLVTIGLSLVQVFRAPFSQSKICQYSSASHEFDWVFPTKE